MSNAVVVEQVTVLSLPVRLPDLLEDVGDIVRLNNAAGSPDLDNGRKVNAPLVLAVGDIDDVHALYEGRQARDVSGDAQVLEEGVALIVIGEVQLLRWEGAVEGSFDVQSLSAVGGRNADEVCGGQRWGGDVQADGFQVGPDTGAFGAVNVLHDFVLNSTEDVLAGLVLLLVNLRADVDEEGTSLVVWSIIMVPVQHITESSYPPIRHPSSTSRTCFLSHRTTCQDRDS